MIRLLKLVRQTEELANMRKLTVNEVKRGANIIFILQSSSLLKSYNI